MSNRRLSAPAQAVSAVPQPAPEISASATAGELMQATFSTALQRWLESHRRVAGGGDDDAIRKLRVAMRRLRYDLVTFARIVDPDASRRLRRPLRDLAAPLGRLRDQEVLMQQLQDHLGEETSADAQTLLAMVGAGHADAADVARATIAAPMYEDTIVAIARASQHPELRVAAETPVAPLLRRALRQSWRDLRAQARRAQRMAEEPDATTHARDEELHATRIAAKRTRYAAESVAQVLGSVATEFAARIAELQAVLGRHQDGIVTADWLDAAAVADPTTAELATWLADLERHDAAAAGAEWEERWAAVRSVAPAQLWKKSG